MSAAQQAVASLNAAGKATQASGQQAAALVGIGWALLALVDAVRQAGR